MVIGEDCNKACRPEAAFLYANVLGPLRYVVYFSTSTGKGRVGSYMTKGKLREISLEVIIAANSSILGDD